MITRLIKSEEEYEKVLARISDLMDAEENTPEMEELELLSVLVEKYEEENYPLPDPDPVDVIQHYLEQRGLKAKDLVGILGDKTTVSKILKKERKLNLGMVRRLHEQANIPLNLLMSEY
jgi:HTH-type transcriptional regulator/antitoxin HigA